jgi:SAM-dependent methyltransferase
VIASHQCPSEGQISGRDPQEAVQRWFDAVYAAKGLAYLRPPEYYDLFLDYLAVRPRERLLDVGCGPGLLLTQALRRGLNCAGIDLSEVALGLARERARSALLARCNGEALCFPDQSFDHVTCIGVVEHFLDVDRALAEMRRVARPEAGICILVPNARSLARICGLRRTASGRPGESVATLDEWAQLFRRNGFLIERVERDQWGVRRLRRVLTGGRRRNGRGASMPRSWSPVPLRYANQFVFILRP